MLIANDSSPNTNDIIPNTVKFWFYLGFLIPSFFCSVFVLHHLLINGKLRNNLYNHAVVIVLIIGLIYETTMYPWMLYYYHREGIWNRSLIFCTIWSFIDWGLYNTQTILFAWATIERHILIFHDRWVGTKYRRLYIHYFPLIFLIVYCLIYYIVICFFPPCENTYYPASMLCATLCITTFDAIVMWDTIMHQILPTLIIAFFSIALLIRICMQKHRIGQSLRWRKHRKMTIQLLSISILYFIFAFPLTLMNVLFPRLSSRSIGDYLSESLYFSNYSMILLFPFASLLSLPQCERQWKICLRFRRRRQVRPAVQTSPTGAHT